MKSAKFYFIFTPVCFLFKTFFSKSNYGVRICRLFAIFNWAQGVNLFPHPANRLQPPYFHSNFTSHRLRHTDWIFFSVEERKSNLHQFDFIFLHLKNIYILSSSTSFFYNQFTSLSNDVFQPILREIQFNAFSFLSNFLPIPFTKISVKKQLSPYFYPASNNFPTDIINVPNWYCYWKCCWCFVVRYFCAW